MFVAGGVVSDVLESGRLGGVKNREDLLFVAMGRPDSNSRKLSTISRILAKLIRSISINTTPNQRPYCLSYKFTKVQERQTSSLGKKRPLARYISNSRKR